jgi:pimeloyl-ACP methyl ester carboxylesterase
VSGAHPASRVRLVLVPGMGVDGRLFDVQREAFPQLEVTRWLRPERRETLAHYAQRLAAMVPRGDGRPMVVGGLSMGGMLALEMAPHLGAKAIVLLASCDHPSAVTPLLGVGERLSRVVPGPVISLGKAIAPMFVGRGGVPQASRAKLQAMLREMDVEFLRWAGRAIMEWPGVRRASAPVHHAHGSRDWVIPVSRLRKRPSVVVEGGAHVLSMSHAGVVNGFVAGVLHGVE